MYYQHAAGLTGVLAFLAGLFFLQRLLARWFTSAVVVSTLGAIVLGTNIFHYGTYDSTFSHAYSFALIAALLDTTDRWWRSADRVASLRLAAIAALLFLTRHPNVVYLIVVPLWNPGAVWSRRRRLLLIAAVAFVGIVRQLLIYKAATGHWLASVYGQLGRFDLMSPRLGAVLFGTAKGLFFWSPILMAAVAGTFIDHPLGNRLRIAAISSLAVTAYLIASWSDWQFGGSFGHRGFTDSLPIAAVYIAVFFDRARRSSTKVPVALVMVAACVLSCAQMLQYWLGVLPIANTTWTQYKDLFLRFR